MDATLKDNPLAILNRILFTHDLDFQVCEPAKVVKVYNDGTALVQPLTKLVADNKTNGTLTEKEVSPIRVSIRNENHGGFYVEHPIMEGETGWVFAADRNTSLVRQYNSSDYPDKNAGAQTPNNDKNLHKSHFGFFIPDRWITVKEELVKELRYPRSKDDRIFCGGAYTIGSNRNKAGNLDSSAKFGVVRNDKDEDVPFTIDEEGHTRALNGDYTGKYYWSLFRLLSDGSVDLFGQGTRFSVRNDGLYLNDRKLKHLADLIISEGDGIEVTMPERKDGKVEYKIGNKGVIALQSGDNIKIEPVTDKKGTFKISSTGGGTGTLKNIAIDSPDNSVNVERGGTDTEPEFHLKVAHPEIGNGTITIKRNGKVIGSFSMNQNEDGTINIEVPDVNYPVKSVDKKTDTFGLDVKPTTGDVKIENTGITGAHIQQSGAARHAQITGGTDTTHNDVSVKTKDVTITLPVPLDIDATTFKNVLANAIHVTLTQTGSAETLDLVEKISLALNLDAANHSIKINGNEVAKFFGTGEVDIPSGGAQLDHSFSWEGKKKADIAASEDIAVDSKTIQGSEGITVSEANRIITIKGSGAQISGYITPEGTYDYEVTGLEWDSTNHRIVIHKVKKTYKNGLLDTREAIADEYIQFVEETV